MVSYRLSKKAESDIVGIAEYTIAHFGVQQARRYRDGMEQIFCRLVKNPKSGRSAEYLAPGLRRVSFRSHVIFFLQDKVGILIVRVLHQRMFFKRHSMIDFEQN